MAEPSGDANRDSLDHHELRQAVERLDELNTNHSRATESVPEIIATVRPELERDFAAVEAYSGKTALSVEICELGVETLAGVAADQPASVGEHAEVLSDALCSGPSTFVRQSAANTLRLVAEYDSNYVVGELPRVVEHVDDPDWEVRRHCLSVLAECADAVLDQPDAVGKLTPRLRDENWLVRTEAAQAVWSVAETDPMAVQGARPALLDCLGDEEPDVRRVAGSALAATADVEFDPLRNAIRERLTDGKTPEERAGALRCAHGLCTRYPDRTEPLTDAVIERLFDPNERVRSASADVLESFARLLPARRDTIVDHLIDALGDSDWTVTSAAAEGLAVIAEGFPEYAEEFVDPLVETLTHDSKLGPYYSGRSLATFLDSVPQMTPAVEARLRQQLLDGDLRVRKNVAMALYELDPDEFESATRVIESLLEDLNSGSMQERRQAAAGLATIAFTDPEMLSEFDPARLTATLGEANNPPAEDATRYIRRMTAVTVLLSLDAVSVTPGAVADAVDLLSTVEPSADRDVRLFAARALGKETTLTNCTTPTEVLSSLVEFASDPDKGVRKRALTGLGTVAEQYPDRVQAHLDVVESAAKDSHPDCRTAAASVIATVGSRQPAIADRCLDTLAALSKDESWQTQVEAYRGFEEIADVAPYAVTGSLDVLVAGLLDYDEDVLFSAAEALAAVLESDTQLSPDSELTPRLHDVMSDPEVSSFCTTIAIELLIRAR